MDVVQKESATPETAFGKYGQFFALLDSEICEYMPKGTPFMIGESSESGKAAIDITPECPCFSVRCLDDRNNIRSLPFFNKTWTAVTQCADHIVFLFVDGNWILHVFECKRTPTEKKWEKILKQFSGAVIRAYAVAGVLRIPEFSGVHLHCCYRKNKSSLATLKTLPGKPAPKDYLKAPITLDSYPELAVKNQPIELNQDGYANIRLHKRGVTRN